MEDKCDSRTMGPTVVNKSKRRREPSITGTPGKYKRRRESHTEDMVLHQQNGKRSPQYMSHVEVPGRTENAESETMAGNNGLKSPEIQENSLAIENVEPTSASPASQPTPTSMPKEVTSSSEAEFFSDPSRLSALQQTITNELGLAVLLKHNELRLIEQEIGKCQVALEQLRRCSVIPFPAMTSNPEDILAVSSGSGLAQAHQPGKLPAMQPAPWGVTDGPYSRHYASWLLPDPTFDGVPVDEARAPARAGKKLSEHQTRGTLTNQSGSTSKARGRRGSGTSRFQALPAGYPEPKEDKKPPILKRASDGKLVRLVCIDCGRKNFNSAQGFINHCRIAHTRNFASHEAAAQICGQEVETDEAGAPVLESPNQAPVASGLVHPLNRSGNMNQVPTLSTPVPKRKSAAQQKPAPRGRPPKHTAQAQTTVQNQSSGQSFVPSSKVPHLSKLLERLQHTGDLNSMVQDATTKENLDTILSDDEQSHAADSDHEMTDAPSPQVMSRIPSRLGIRGGPASSSLMNNGIPGSRKGPDRVIRHSEANTIQDSASRAMPHNSATFTLPSSLPHDLSPHTVESNVAPSLVSDDEDDDYASQASEMEETSGAEDDEQDVDVDVNNVEMRGGFMDENVASSSIDPELRASSKVRNHSARSRQVILREPAAGVRRTGKKAGRGRPRK